MSLKRAELSEDSSPEPKRHATGPSGQVCLRALIEASQCSRLIGPRGENLRQMRKNADETGQLRAHISSDNGAKWRVIHVTGSTLAVGKFYGLVVRRFLDEGLGPATSESRGYNLHMLIPNSLMGKVIGKGMSVLRNIEEESSAALSADRGILPHSDDRLVHIYGVCDAIHIAAFHIGEILAQQRDRPASREYVPEQGDNTPEVGLGGGNNHRRSESSERARNDEIGQRMDRYRAPGAPAPQAPQATPAQGVSPENQDESSSTPCAPLPAPSGPDPSAPSPSLSLTMPEGAPRALQTAFETAKQSRKPTLRQIIKTRANIDKLVKDISQVTETTLTVLDAEEGTLQIEGPPEENELAIFLAFRHLKRSKE